MFNDLSLSGIRKLKDGDGNYLWQMGDVTKDSPATLLGYPDGGKDIYTGLFHLESFEITGSNGERVQISVTMQSDGEIVHERTT